jgi:glycosyltransferase involved in cell wall biosynthesis
MSDAYLGIAAIVRNEAPSILEWVAFHQLVGVECFDIYDNGSTDETVELLSKVDGVTVLDWPGERQQLHAYAHAIRGARTRWLAFLDADEFLFSPQFAPLPVLLRAHEDWDAIGACWALFGTSLVKCPHASTLATYTLRAAFENLMHRHVKSIVQPARVPARPPPDPHHFACATWDMTGRRVHGPLAQGATWQGLRVNHYISKSIQEARAKMLRPRADNSQLRTLDLCSPALNAEADFLALPYDRLVQARAACLQSR